MKSLPEEELSIETPLINVVDQPSSGIFARMKGIVRQFKQDLRMPIPGAERMSFRQRFQARAVYLFKRYGWKLLLGLFLYYLIRDTILYIIIPYLVARQVLG
jgi:hypothetical protein